MVYARWVSHRLDHKLCHLSSLLPCTWWTSTCSALLVLDKMNKITKYFSRKRSLESSTEDEDEEESSSNLECSELDSQERSLAAKRSSKPAKSMLSTGLVLAMYRKEWEKTYPWVYCNKPCFVAYAWNMANLLQQPEELGLLMALLIGITQLSCWNVPMSLDGIKMEQLQLEWLSKQCCCDCSKTSNSTYNLFTGLGRFTGRKWRWVSEETLGRPSNAQYTSKFSSTSMIEAIST